MVSVNDLRYLLRPIKAPRIRKAVSRVAERACLESWTHEDIPTALLEQEVLAREA